MKSNKLLAGAVTLALTAVAQAATHFVGNTVDTDRTTIIDLAAGAPPIAYGGSYSPADPGLGLPAVWTWPKNDTFILQEIIVIKGGILVIESGSGAQEGVVRGQPRTDGSTYDGGTLLIAAGAKLIADGGNSNSPIVFTTASTTGAATGGRYTGVGAFWDAAPKTNPQSSNTAGLWGGVVILGNAPTNVDRDQASGISVDAIGGTAGTNEQVIFGTGNASGQFSGVTKAGGAYGPATTTASTDDRAEIEGIPTASAASTQGLTRYGGFAEQDNSGVVRFVSIRHGGTELAPNSEVNGLTLGGVGRGTTVEFVEIYGNTDDGVEIFGGTVNLKNILIVDCDDDGLDLDAGYTGTIQFLVVICGDQSDKVGEWDGSYESETVNGFTGTGPVTMSKLPLANYNIYNATLVGNPGPANGSGSGHTNGRGLHIRDQSAARLVNSIYVNPKANPIEVDNRATAAGRTTVDRWVQGLAEFRGVTMYDSTGTFTSATSWTAGGSDDSTIDTQLAVAPRLNVFNVTPGFANLPTLALARSATPIDLVPDSGTAGPGALDAVLEDPVANYNGSVLSTFYRGAFDIDATELWTSAWTASATVVSGQSLILP